MAVSLSNCVKNHAQNLSRI